MWAHEWKRRGGEGREAPRRIRVRGWQAAEPGGHTRKIPCMSQPSRVLWEQDSSPGAQDGPNELSVESERLS